MKSWLWFLAIGLVSLSAIAADDPKTPPAKQEPPQQAADAKAEFAAIQKEWQTQQMAFGKKHQDATTNEERQKLFQTDYPKAEPLALRCLKLAEKWPTAPEAVDALFWAVANGATGTTAKNCAEQLKTLWIDKASLDDINKKLMRQYMINSTDLQTALLDRAEKEGTNPKAVPLLMWLARQGLYLPMGSPISKKAQAILLDKFLESMEIGQFCSVLAESRDTKAIETLKLILEKNSHEEVKAYACFALGKQLSQKESTQPEAEKYFERVLSEFKKADKNLIASAKGELNELRYLSVGKVVPDIVAKDLDDKEFKLTEYRGKVILLDFWGFW